MSDWKRALINNTSTIHEAMQAIDESVMQIAVVTDDQLRILGTVTDGDIRRAILHGVSLENKAQEIMNKNPSVAHLNDGKESILAAMKLTGHKQMPIIDSDNRVINITTMENMVGNERKENCVIIMAGGEGKRLRPLTEDLPKPLLKVGGKPILETIVGNFREYGFYHFYISVNYKAEMIKDYFGDGSNFGLEIEYIHEEFPMGTAGALSLLENRPDKPFMVMNSDLITNVNFNHLLDYHASHSALATMCVRQYDFQVPYGVIEIEKSYINTILEKPVHSFFVNAGIYVLDPGVLDYVPKQSYFDMTTLFTTLSEKKQQTVAFPIREHWVDVGNMKEFEIANLGFDELIDD